MYTPTPCLRQKKDMTAFNSALDAFKRMPMGDTWEDAELPKMFFYILKNKKLRSPTREWKAAIDEFAHALAKATRLMKQIPIER